MANRYCIKFSKQGYVKYTSHLDLLRVFKRGFKKANINLEYSKGFNPHPKLGFAQPLSLGYSSICEFIEFETVDEGNINEMFKNLARQMPIGIDFIGIKKMPDSIKSLAKDTEMARYTVTFPIEIDEKNLKILVENYLEQDVILAMKRQKKTKDYKEINIKHLIRSITGYNSTDSFVLDMCLDCGSQSNLSPELVISSFLDFSKLPLNRYDIEVERRDIIFSNNLHF